MTPRVEKWDYFELVLEAGDTSNPYTDVTFEAEFAQPDQTVHLHGFYDGDGIYKMRFMPQREGAWRYTTRSNLPALDGIQGEIVCIPAGVENHGPVRVAENIHFAYADGTRYIPVGTTCYVWNLQGDELETRTLQTLKTAPFNKIRMCAFPKRYTFNLNEPPSYPFPGEVTRPWNNDMLNQYRFSEPPGYWDFSQFNPVYFRHLEQRILDLRALGMEADLILFHPYDFGAWGFDRMPAEVNERYIKYLVARLSAFRNVWWSFANEYDLMHNRRMEDWDQYFQLVQGLDPYQHLRSIHNCNAFYDHTKPWVTHCSIQNGELNKTGNWLRTYQKPVVVDECGYEGDIHMLWGDLSADELVARFWHGFTRGGYVGHGETYRNEQDQLWWSKGGDLIGESVARIAFLRNIFENAPPLYPFLLSEPGSTAPTTPFYQNAEAAARIVPEGIWNIEAGGHHGLDYFIFYFGMHQPRRRNFRLPEGSYLVDLIDTWNMTIEPVMKNAEGEIQVELPGRKFMALRIQKNED